MTRNRILGQSLARIIEDSYPILIRADQFRTFLHDGCQPLRGGLRLPLRTATQDAVDLSKMV
jgi:hypothetical protein